MFETIRESVLGFGRYGADTNSEHVTFDLQLCFDFEVGFLKPWLCTLPHLCGHVMKYFQNWTMGKEL